MKKLKSAKCMSVPVEWLSQLDLLAKNARKAREINPDTEELSRLIGYASSVEVILKYGKKVDCIQ